MSSLKKLASQTAYYGLSSILGRMLNYALVPLHTRILTSQLDYGIVGELYSYVSFLNIIFLYGMETAFFRFATRDKGAEQTWYSNAFTSVLTSSVILTGLMIFFSGDILQWLQPEGSPAVYLQEYVIYFALVLGLDAISAIPFAKLRLDNRPLKFAGIKVFGIAVNVLLNVFFLVYCPYALKQDASSWVASIYTEGRPLHYIFLANVVASVAPLILLYREILSARIRIHWQQLKPMLVYSLPLLFAGLAGMTNETMDRILLKYYLPGTVEERLAQIGVYNAAYKLSIFMTLAIQSFRMAAEPFFFSMYKESNSAEVYARVMKYFVIVCCMIFLGVMLHIDIIAELIGGLYRAGIFVVPVLLMANLFFGIYLNLSIWYKLTEKTMYGTYFTLFGAFLTILLNILWIPHYGYEGSAYATLICYLMMAVACYITGQKYYPIPYPLGKIIGYMACMLAVYGLSWLTRKYLFEAGTLAAQLVNSFLFVFFVISVYYAERKSLLRKTYAN